MRKKIYKLLNSIFTWIDNWTFESFIKIFKLCLVLTVIIGITIGIYINTDGYINFFDTLINALADAILNNIEISALIAVALIPVIGNIAVKSKELRKAEKKSLDQLRTKVYCKMIENIYKFYRMTNEEKEKNKLNFKEYFIKDNLEFPIYASKDVLDYSGEFINHIGNICFIDANEDNDEHIKCEQKLSNLIRAVRNEIGSIGEYNINYAVFLNDLPLNEIINHSEIYKLLLEFLKI